MWEDEESCITFWLGTEGRTVMLAGGKRQSLVQYTQATGGREPQTCFNQLWGVHIEVVGCQLAEFCSLFSFSCCHQSHPEALLLCPD